MQVSWKAGRWDCVFLNETRYAGCVQSNIETRSRNHCCSGKEITIKYSEYVCGPGYPEYKANAPCYIVM